MSVQQANPHMPKKDKNLKTLKSYVVGFLLALVLTLLSFGVAAEHALFTVSQFYVTLVVLAVLQLLVQVTFFLRLNAAEEGRWNLMPFLFTIVIVLVILIGSLWIMYNLNYNMGG